MVVSQKMILRIMKDRYRLSYRKIKRIPYTGNSEQNKVLRSLYSQKMLQIYSQGKHIVNIDETWIPESDFRRRRWVKKNGNNSM